MNPSIEELTRIYNEANGIEGGKNPPITTERIFNAMRACLAIQQPGEYRMVPLNIEAFADTLIEMSVNNVPRGQIIRFIEGNLSAAPLPPTSNAEFKIPPNCKRIEVRYLNDEGVLISIDDSDGVESTRYLQNLKELK
jgi:hypothetical protein